MITDTGKNLAYIFSTPRSGSTLLAAMLGSNSDVYAPPEPWFLLLLHSLLSGDDAIVTHYDEHLARRALRELVPENLIGEASRRYALTVYNELLVKNKKKYFIDKTPRYYHIIDWIDSLFPEAQKILLTRNPLDVYASYKEIWGITAGEMIGEQLSPYSFDATIAYFEFQKFSKYSDAHTMRISYENLVSDPATVMHGVCNFLGLTFDERMISYGENKELLTLYTNSIMGDRKVLSEMAPHRKSCGKWKTVLTPPEIQKIITALGTGIFEENGYAAALREACTVGSLQYENVGREGRKEELYRQYQNYIGATISTSAAHSHVAFTRKNEELLTTLATIEKERKEHIEALAGYQNRLAESEAAHVERDTRVQQLLEENLKIQDHVAESRDVIEQRNIRIRQLQEENRKIQERVVEFRTAIEQQNKNIQQLQEGSRKFQDQAVGSRAAIEQSDQRAHHLLDENRGLQTQLAGLRDTIQQIEKDRQDRLKAIQYYQKVVSDFQNRSSEIEKEHADLQKLVPALWNRIVELGTLQSSIRRIIELSLRGIGLYDIFLRHRKIFDRIFLFTVHAVTGLASSMRKFLRTPAPNLPGAGSAPLQSQTLKETLDSHEVNAFITSQEIHGDLEDAVMHHFLENNSSFSSIICLMPDRSDLQLLLFLQGLGKSVFILYSSSEGKKNVQTENALPSGIADEWFMKHGRVGLSNYDALFIGKNCSQSYITLLHNYLSPRTAIIFHHAGTSEELSFCQGREKVTVGSFTYFSPVPDSAGVFTTSGAHRTVESALWPWKTITTEMPPAMPSGRPWPKISVITATLNQGDYLEETIRSVLLQRYPNIEYIILDGGSRDRTPEILARYKHECAVCISQKDRGQADALNKGFSYATGEIITWLNSDDRYLPNTFLDVALAFDTYACDMVAGGCALVFQDEQVPRRIHHAKLPLGEKGQLQLSRLLDLDGCWLKGDFFYQPEVFWSRNIWEKTGKRIETSMYYSMDYELWVRMAVAKASIVHIPEPLVHFRIHERQKTSGSNLPYLPELRKLNRKLLKNLRKK